MKNGFGLATLLIAGGILVVVSATIAAAYTLTQKGDRKIGNFKPNELFKNNFGQLEKEESQLTDDSGTSTNATPIPSPSSEATSSPTSRGGSPSSSGSSGSGTVYKQPQDLYTITLPSGWVVNSTFATNTYSTTKFTGPIGNVSITFGTGKDPLGGCSETSAIVLADRTISGCYLLQKDGSRILTRGITKTSGNLQITIEAFISSPLADNQPVITSIIKTIDVN